MKNWTFTHTLVAIISMLGTLFLLVHLYSPEGYLKDTLKTGTLRSSNLSGKLLIAKQGSPFKDSIVVQVVHRYSSHPVEITLLDITALKSIDPFNFDAIFLIYRWEARNPPEAIQAFVKQHVKLKSKIVVLTTSWNGLEKMEGLDAITGASIGSDVSMFSDNIIKELDRLLYVEN
ncbi:hypothetical protein ACFQZJ_10670 [Maribacter chungangensis]|uniref:DUF4350 domain-containing protein n=1 Tax=Maribacter chungangensis TaxID=1069117 RepID=A0ABW3B4Z3_9FLAO